MQLILNRTSEQPLHRQIERQIRTLIEAGDLGVGSRLPASRILSRSLGVNRATVRAIAETGVERISVGALTHSAVSLDAYDPLQGLIRLRYWVHGDPPCRVGNRMLIGPGGPLEGTLDGGSSSAKTAAVYFSAISSG